MCPWTTLSPALVLQILLLLRWPCALYLHRYVSGRHCSQAKNTMCMLQGSRCSSSHTCTQTICRGSRTAGVRCVPSLQSAHASSASTCKHVHPVSENLSDVYETRAHARPLVPSSLMCPVQCNPHDALPHPHRQGTLYCSQLSRSVPKYK